MSGERIVVRTGEDSSMVGTAYGGSSESGVVLFPGTNQHRASLHTLATKLQEIGFSAFAFDIPGQGDSTGNWNLDQVAAGVHTATSEVKKRYDLTSVGGYGNSIGGMGVGLAAVVDNSPLDCICLSSTPAGLQDVRLGRVLNVLLRLPSALFKNSPDFSRGALGVAEYATMLENIEAAPRLDGVSERIAQPTLFVYGGEDNRLGIRGGVLPQEIDTMYKKMNALAELSIVSGADHSLHTKGGAQEYFTNDPRYTGLVNMTVGHFARNLL